MIGYDRDADAKEFADQLRRTTLTEDEIARLVKYTCGLGPVQARLADQIDKYRLLVKRDVPHRLAEMDTMLAGLDQSDESEVNAVRTAQIVGRFVSGCSISAGNGVAYSGSRNPKKWL